VHVAILTPTFQPRSDDFRLAAEWAAPRTGSYMRYEAYRPFEIAIAMERGGRRCDYRLRD